MNITDLARDELSKVLQTQEATGVRVYFNGFGWGGPNFGVALDEPQPEDHVEVINRIHVAIDPYMYNFMAKDLVLDYVKERKTFSFRGIQGSSC